MTGAELFWLIILLTAFWPYFQQRFLIATRQRLIARIERDRKSRLILLVHRQETMSLLGFPLMRYIDIEDSEQILRAIHMTDPEVPLDLVLHTPGGLALASLQIAQALIHHKGKVTVFVPHYAMSGGTLIALAADEIVMTPYAVLGPVDPQLGQFPAASVLQVVRQKPVKEIEDKTLILADQAEKAIAQLRAAVFELLQQRLEQAKAWEIATILSEGHWTHDYPLTYERAKALHLPVTEDCPEAILQLMALFPQPMRRSGVEYTPFPRSRDKT